MDRAQRVGPARTWSSEKSETPDKETKALEILREALKPSSLALDYKGQAERTLTGDDKVMPRSASFAVLHTYQPQPLLIETGHGNESDSHGRSGCIPMLGAFLLLLLFSNTN